MHVCRADISVSSPSSSLGACRKRFSLVIVDAKALHAAIKVRTPVVTDSGSISMGNGDDQKLESTRTVA